MIRLIKTHNHKRRTKDEWCSVVISYAISCYEQNGRVVASEIRRLVGRKVDDLFGGIHNLISASGLPADAMYGSCICEYCGEVFIRGEISARYCCRDHQAKSLSRKRSGFIGNKFEEVKCNHCGVLFELGDRAKKYCSIRCRNKEMSRAGKKRRRAISQGVLSIPYTAKAVVDIDGSSCSHCGVDTSTECSVVADHRQNIDHIIPLSKGGHDAIYNCQVLCRRCNIKKGNKISSLDYSKAMSQWPTKLSVNELKKAERPSSLNTSGIKGVFFDSNKNTWFAQIDKGSRRVRVRGSSKEQAIEIRRTMKACLDRGMDMSNIKLEAFKCRCQESQRQ